MKNFLSKISLVLCLVAFSGCQRVEEKIAQQENTPEEESLSNTSSYPPQKQCEDGSNFNIDTAEAWELLEPSETSTRGEHYQAEPHFDFWIPSEYMGEFNVFGRKEAHNKEITNIAFAAGTDPGCTALPIGDVIGVNISILNSEDFQSTLRYFEEYSIPKESIDLSGTPTTLYKEKWLGGSFLASYFLEMNGVNYKAQLSYNEDRDEAKFLEDVLSSLQSTAPKEN